VHVTVICTRQKEWLMSTSQMKMRGRGAARGLFVGTTALALATVGLAAPASAGTGTVAYSCSIFSSKFDYKAKITVKGPAKRAKGSTATVTVDLSPLPGVSPVTVDSWKSTAKLTLSGAQKGTVTATGPNKKGPIKPKGKIPLGKLTAKVKLKKTGKVQFAPGEIKVTAVAYGSSVTMPCKPKKKSTPKLLKITVRR